MEDNKGLVLFYFVLVRFEVSKITYIFTGWASGFRILTEITDQSSPQTPQAQPSPRPHHAASRRLFGSPSGSFRLSSVCLFSDILFIQHCFPLWGRKLTIYFFKILKIFSLSPSRWIKTAGKIKRDLKLRRERRALEEGVCLWPLQQAALASPTFLDSPWRPERSLSFPPTGGRAVKPSRQRGWAPVKT